MRWNLQLPGCAAKQEYESQRNVFLRDLDVMAVPALDARRIEVIAEGLPAFHGPSWRLTPPWSHPSVLMASLTDDGSYGRIHFIQKRFHPLTLSSKHDFIQ